MQLQGCIQARFVGKITSIVTKEAIGKAKVAEKVTKLITFYKKLKKSNEKSIYYFFSSNSFRKTNEESPNDSTQFFGLIKLFYKKF